MTSPTPPQTGHGRDVMTWPSSERWTVWISPCPPHVSQVIGVDLPWVPLPWHRSHNTAVSTVTCLVTPVAQSSRSRRIRSSESAPGRTLPIGPRDVAPAAEERLEHVAEPAEAAEAVTAAAAADSSGSPPRSTMRRFSGSLSTS